MKQIMRNGHIIPEITKWLIIVEINFTTALAKTISTKIAYVEFTYLQLIEKLLKIIALYEQYTVRCLFYYILKLLM